MKSVDLEVRSNHTVQHNITVLYENVTIEVENFNVTHACITTEPEQQILKSN